MRRPRKGIIITAATLLVIVAGYVGLVVYYQGESTNRSGSVIAGQSTNPDRVDVNAKLLSVDPVLNQAVVRLNFNPRGSLVKSESGPLAAPLKLFTNSANGARERSFDAGKDMAPLDLTVDMFDGSITDYPFDKYSSALTLAVTDAPKDVTQAKQIPVSITFNAAIHGVDVVLTEGSKDEQAGGVTATDLTITRSLTTVAVAIFIMVMLLGMALAILGVTLSVLAFGQKLDLPILALSGALMFGFVAFRNAMPGTPPIGSLSDYLSFFWAEGIVASCLFALAVHYLRGLHRAAS